MLGSGLRLVWPVCGLSLGHYYWLAEQQACKAVCCVSMQQAHSLLTVRVDPALGLRVVVALNARCGPADPGEAERCAGEPVRRKPLEYAPLAPKDPPKSWALLVLPTLGLALCKGLEPDGDALLRGWFGGVGADEGEVKELGPLLGALALRSGPWPCDLDPAIECIIRHANGAGIGNRCTKAASKRGLGPQGGDPERHLRTQQRSGRKEVHTREDVYSISMPRRAPSLAGVFLRPVKALQGSKLEPTSCRGNGPNRHRPGITWVMNSSIVLVPGGRRPPSAHLTPANTAA